LPGDCIIAANGMTEYSKLQKDTPLPAVLGILLKLDCLNSVLDETFTPLGAEFNYCPIVHAAMGIGGLSTRSGDASIF